LTGNATILDNPGQNGHRVAHFDACWWLWVYILLLDLF
jgi:hypothetical protein